MATADIDAAFAAAEKAQQQARQALEESEARIRQQQADDRSVIAKRIVNAFVAAIALLLIWAALGTWLSSWDRIAEPAKFMLGMLSSVLLPVVTLVIGYYFGSAKGGSG
ncbi:MAG: hypothetical protein OEV81_10550 [Betaproteobacteria bacterium]|nr:hypothetical protein [Betaproteobacteria bacterium]MDH5222721.1 hypothetical protein [Betaproteobacteria bacterium]MDH5351075.1 hypothetical protein [Betaproteobacteria bacterium]